MAEALKMAFPSIQFVDRLESFMNFADSVEETLNCASTTPGLTVNTYFLCVVCWQTLARRV
jgi:hypothetical protein